MNRNSCVVEVWKLGDVYVIHPLRRGDYLIDGKLVEGLTLAQSPHRPKEIKRLIRNRVIKSYGNLSPDEYRIQLEHLKKEYGIFVDEDGDCIFPNLDAEYTYRKFQEQHPPVFEDVVEYVSCEIRECNIEGKTDNPFIKPLRLVSEDYKRIVREGKLVYVYTPNFYKMGQLVASNLGLKEVFDNREKMEPDEWDVPEYSRRDGSLKFLRIGGKFADYASLPPATGVIGTWEECYQRFKEHWQAIERVFKIGIAKVSKNPIDIGAEITFLETILSSLNDIQVKKNSLFQFRSIKKKLREHIERLAEKDYE